MKNICYIIVCLIVFFSCTTKSTNEGLMSDSQTLDFSVNKEFIANDWVESIRFLPLEKNKESYFGNISKLQIEENIYIMDCFVTHQLFVFNKEGRFLFKVGNKGKGKGEYTRLCDFDITKDGSILLYSRKEMKLIYFDSQGRFDHEVRLPFRADGFKVVGDKIIFSRAKSQNAKFMITLTDLNLNVLEEYIEFPMEHKDDKFNYKMFTDSSTESILYTRSVSNSVYKFNHQGKLEKIVNFNFGKYQVPEDMLYSYEDIIANREQLPFRYIMSTPYYLGKYMFGSLWLEPKNKGFFWYNSESSELFVKSLEIENFSHKNINIPLAKIDEKNIIVSYYDLDHLAIDKDKNLISPKILQHVENGGVSLCFYEIKK